MVYPRICSTDLDGLMLLASFGEIGWFGGFAPSSCPREGKETRAVTEGRSPHVPRGGSHTLRVTKTGHEPNGMKFRGKLSVCKGVSDVGLPSYLRYAMACDHNPCRRWNDGSQCHRRAEPIQHSVGDPVATRSDHPHV